MDNLSVGNVVSSWFRRNSNCPSCPASFLRSLWKSLRNDPGQCSDHRQKVTGLKSESVTGIIPES